VRDCGTDFCDRTDHRVGFCKPNSEAFSHTEQLFDHSEAIERSPMDSGDVRHGSFHGSVILHTVLLNCTCSTPRTKANLFSCINEKISTYAGV
jgi:hypothetical protein